MGESRQRPFATHPKDREWYRGVLAALSIAKSCRTASEAVAKIIATIGEAELRERARLDGTLGFAGLAKPDGPRPGARSARKAPRPPHAPRRKGRENSGAGKPAPL